MEGPAARRPWGAWACLAAAGSGAWLLSNALFAESVPLVAGAPEGCRVSSHVALALQVASLATPLGLLPAFPAAAAHRWKFPVLGGALGLELLAALFLALFWGWQAAGQSAAALVAAVAAGAGGGAANLSAFAVAGPWGRRGMAAMAAGMASSGIVVSLLAGWQGTDAASLRFSPNVYWLSVAAFGASALAAWGRLWRLGGPAGDALGPTDAEAAHLLASPEASAAMEEAHAEDAAQPRGTARPGRSPAPGAWERRLRLALIGLCSMMEFGVPGLLPFLAGAVRGGGSGPALFWLNALYLSSMLASRGLTAVLPALRPPSALVLAAAQLSIFVFALVEASGRMGATAPLGATLALVGGFSALHGFIVTDSLAWLAGASSKAGDATLGGLFIQIGALAGAALVYVLVAAGVFGGSECDV